MPDGTSQRDQAGGMVREFKMASKTGSRQGGIFFPDPRIHHSIKAERQRALDEIASFMRRSPAPSSTRLSTEARHSFPTPNHVPGPVPEGFMEEPPPHPDPVPSSVLEGSQAEPPSHSVPVREGLVNGLPPLPAPVPSPVLEGSEDELPPPLFLVAEEFVEDLSRLPVPVPEGCENAPFPPAVSRRLRRRSPSPHQKGPPRFPRGLLSSTGVLLGPGRQISRGQPADRRVNQGRTPVRPPELWVCRGNPAPQEWLPETLAPLPKGPPHPPCPKKVPKSSLVKNRFGTLSLAPFLLLEI
ncbi:hypothetical protein CRENBAI_021947 [Crenichthys baileyi]|uniref:Uncharacterized protein n=1 Tax=Crenichthys baileyi TaxID=28760 RepID=A0AAV9SPE2_9TELE